MDATDVEIEKMEGDMITLRDLKPDGTKDEVARVWDRWTLADYANRYRAMLAKGEQLEPWYLRIIAIDDQLPQPTGERPKSMTKIAKVFDREDWTPEQRRTGHFCWRCRECGESRCVMSAMWLIVATCPKCDGADLESVSPPPGTAPMTKADWENF